MGDSALMPPRLFKGRTRDVTLPIVVSAAARCRLLRPLSAALVHMYSNDASLSQCHFVAGTVFFGQIALWPLQSAYFYGKDLIDIGLLGLPAGVAVFVGVSRVESGRVPGSSATIAEPMCPSLTLRSGLCDRSAHPQTRSNQSTTPGRHGPHRCICSVHGGPHAYLQSCRHSPSGSLQPALPRHCKWTRGRWRRSYFVQLISAPAPRSTCASSQSSSRRRRKISASP
jgi:hypothetical protein